jgi:hypothetical protein
MNVPRHLPRKLVEGAKIAAIIALALVAITVGVIGDTPFKLRAAFGIYGLCAMGAILYLRQAKAKDIVPGTIEGYADKDGKLHAHHVLATAWFLTSVGAYYLVFLIKSPTTNPSWFGTYPVVPTLAVVLLVLVLTCSTLAGISFFLDRYRIPLVLPIVVWTSATSMFPQSDHFYAPIPPPAGRASGHLAPGIVLAQRGARPVVLVAATGGGIQAAAWTTRVLRGLQAEAQLRNQDFAPAVKLISSVSGGSVGSMYFLHTYGVAKGKRCGTQLEDPKDINRDCVVEAAQTSSLDEVAVGLVYNDLLLNLFPFVKGVDLQRGKLVNGRGIMADRGRALEDSFKRESMPALDSALLLEWKEDVRADKRPGAIFNATIVETGTRLLLATADIDEAKTRHGTAHSLGRVSFHDLHPKWDLAVATAVRLSATFPYVTPAARIFEGDVYRPSDHVVDGGYFDNYGIASLVEWLDQGLTEIREKGTTPPPIMVLEIRASPGDDESVTQEAGMATNGFLEQHNERGFLFQTLHPFTTFWNVRGTGQFSHNQIQMRLLKDRWRNEVKICSAVFEFKRPDGYRNRPEPLSWHLTQDDVNALVSAWRTFPQSEKDKVAAFVERGSCQN